MMSLRRSPRWASQMLVLFTLLNACVFITLVHHLLASADLATEVASFFRRVLSDPQRLYRTDAAQADVQDAQHALSPCAPLDDACSRYGADFVVRSRAYEGTNSRLRRVLREAEAGRPVKVGVVGGSVTFGQGVHGNDTWTAVFGAWWRDRLPLSKLTLVNGAVPATGSGYWSMCFREHIDEDVDLVLTELAINDLRTDADAQWFEWLVRQLLELPKAPAVVHLQVFALAQKDFATITLGGDVHIGVANYYDTPVVSLRNALLPRILAAPSTVSDYFSIDRFGLPDLKHINAQGHRMLADLLTSHFARQLWIARSPPELPAKFGDIPPLRMFQRYGSAPPPRLQAYCASTRSTRTPLVPAFNDGRWRTVAHAAPGGSRKTYIVAREPGAKVGFTVPVGGLGRVRMQSLRSGTIGLGICKCWLDNDERAALRVDGYWESSLNIAGTTVLATNVSAGHHVLWCELTAHTRDPQHRTEFRIIAVDAA